MLADLGGRHSVVNLPSRALSEGNTERAQRLVFGRPFLKLFGSLVIATVGWFTAPFLTVSILQKPALAPYPQVTSIGVCVWALWDALEGALQARQKFSWGAGCRFIFESHLMLALANSAISVCKRLSSV